MSLEIRNVTKYYGKKLALDGVSLTFENGIYGLLGANGAGKSTLLNIMVTALAPTDGSVYYNGTDIRNKRSGYLDALGYMPQNPRFYKNYTAQEFLRYMAALKGVDSGVEGKIDDLLGFVNLSDCKKMKVGSFSGGMKQRLGIAQAMLNDPAVLILDEPTAGLDPIERIRFRNLISGVAADRTVILATHIVPDIEYIANRVVLLNEGRLCRNDTPVNLCREINGKVWDVTADESGLEDVVTRYKISNIHTDGGVYRLRVVSEEKPCDGARNVDAKLEDVFLYHAGEVSV